jgi:hypothetical protein
MDNNELIDTIFKAMRTAWQLGQTYWRQADSDFTSDHRRSDETQRKYDALVQETIAALSRSQDVARMADIDEAKGAIEALDLDNHRMRRAMQKIMARLTELLDEDQFANIESIAKEAGVEPPTASAADVAPIDDDDADIAPTPESERAAFNAMLRWHLIRLLQAWRYGGNLREAGMAAFEWARANNVGQEAFKASERAAKIATPAPAEPKGERRAKPISDEMMDLVDRLGSEAAQVDPRAWKHLLVYAPKPERGAATWSDEQQADFVRCVQDGMSHKDAAEAAGYKTVPSMSEISENVLTELYMRAQSQRRSDWVENARTILAAPAPAEQPFGQWCKEEGKRLLAKCTPGKMVEDAPAPAEPKGEQPILFQDWYEGLSPQWRRVIEAIDPLAAHNGGKNDD